MLEPRIGGWPALYGPAREVYVEPVAVRGREAEFDFTDASSLGATIHSMAFSARVV